MHTYILFMHNTLCVCLCTIFVQILWRIHAQKLSYCIIKWKNNTFPQKGKQLRCAISELHSPPPPFQKFPPPGLVYMKKGGLREDMFHRSCKPLLYVCDSMYTCLFRRISCHRFGTGVWQGSCFAISGFI